MISRRDGTAADRRQGGATGRRRREMIAGGLVLAAGLLIIAGIAADAPSASAAQAVHTDLNYTCAFPAGDFAVGVAITSTFAASATAGAPIGPISLRMTTRLPRPAIASLTGTGDTGRTSLSAADVLSVTETGHAQSGQVQWHLAAAPAGQPAPATGPVALQAIGTGSVSPIASPGLLTFTASTLNLTLQARRLGGSPRTVSATCALTGAAPPRLAAIRVTAASPTPAPSASATSTRQPARRTKAPKGCGQIKVVGTGTATCGYLTGYADVAKLIGAALLQPKLGRPALVNVDFAEHHGFKHDKLIEHSTGELYYHGQHALPPVTATFLAFRFVPVTATLHITELTSVAILSASGITAPPYPITVKATTKAMLKVTDVSVNGLSLKVGTQCRIAAPLILTLIGKGDNTIPPKGYTVPTGGTLAGRVTIPPFTHCGTTENLDPLLTGSISGHGNYVKMTQGKLCGPAQPANWTCPPPVPKARH
jgi:uncharacterized protein DUF6801